MRTSNSNMSNLWYKHVLYYHLFNFQLMYLSWKTIIRREYNKRVKFGSEEVEIEGLILYRTKIIGESRVPLLQRIYMKHINIKLLYVSISFVYFNDMYH